MSIGSGCGSFADETSRRDASRWRSSGTTRSPLELWIELTHHWGEHDYDLGSAFGHVAIGVRDARAAVEALRREGTRVVRPVGPLKGDPGEISLSSKTSTATASS
jgi:hypothetical protein